MSNQAAPVHPPLYASGSPGFGPEPSSSAVARATDLTKVHGPGETRVVALDQVSVEFRTAEFAAIMGPSRAELGQTIVMVTHDPVAAAYADRVVFLADGRIADELPSPSPDGVLDRMRRFDARTS